VKVLCSEGLANHTGPEPCGVACEGSGEASAGERAGQVLSPETTIPGTLTRYPPRKATRPGAPSRAPGRAGVVRDPGMCGSSLHGNREVPHLTARGGRPASGRRGAEADDARTREVGCRHSSREANEQSGAIRGGVGGAKGGGQGECGPAKHGPDAEPGNRGTGTGPHTASLPSDTQGGSRMPESGSYGSVRGVLSNEHPYRD